MTPTCHTHIEHLPLFDGCVNPSVLPDDEVRLSGQNFRIFRRLMQGPATNRELMDLSRTMNFSGRLSDVRQRLREHGWDVRITHRYASGVCVYTAFRADGTAVLPRRPGHGR